MTASWVQVLDAVISALAVLILAGMVRSLAGIRKDFRQFMKEHRWLMDSVQKLMVHSDLSNGPPPRRD